MATRKRLFLIFEIENFANTQLKVTKFGGNRPKTKKVINRQTKFTWKTPPPSADRVKPFNLLCAVVDVCSILRFTQRVQLLPILMFTRTATETRKRTLFKYVINIKLFSKCEYITYSLSISLMTYFRCMQLCHTLSICLTWREIIAAKFHLPSCSFSKILPYFDTHGI